MTKKEFVLLALEEVELNNINKSNLIEFWENQYSLFKNGYRGEEIHNFTDAMLSPVLFTCNS